MTKKSWQKFKYLENKKNFSDEIKIIFHNFYRAIIEANKKFFGRWQSDFKLFRVDIFKSVTKFTCLTIWLFSKRRPLSVGFSKKWNANIRDFALRKKRREKTQKAKVIKSCRQVTWVQESMTERERTFTSKIFKYE